MPPPPAHRYDRPAEDVLHGETIPDPYRWLEDGEAPETRAWTEAQNALHRGATSPALPRARPSARRLDAAARHRRAQHAHAGAWPLLLPAARGPAEPAGALRRATASTARTGSRSIPTRSIQPAPPRSTGTIPATTAPSWPMGCPRTGSEQSVLHVLDVDPGVTLADRISRTRAADLAWLPDGSGFYYTRYPAPGTVPAGEEHYHRGVYFHRLGSDPDDRPAGLPARAKRNTGRASSLSPDGRWLLIQRGPRPSIRPTSTWATGTLAPATSSAPLVAVAEDLPASFEGEVAHGRLFLRTNLDAPTYRLYEVDPEQPGTGRTGARSCRRERTRCSKACRCTADRLALELPRAGLVPAPPRRPRRRPAAARSPLPTLGQPVRPRGRVGRRRAVLRILVLHGAAERLPARPRHGDEQTLWRRVEADLDPEPVRGAAGELSVARRHRGDDVPRPPQRARPRRATRRPISPATAASTSA